MTVRWTVRAATGFSAEKESHPLRHNKEQLSKDSCFLLYRLWMRTHRVRRSSRKHSLQSAKSRAVQFFRAPPSVVEKTNGAEYPTLSANKKA